MNCLLMDSEGRLLFLLFLVISHVRNYRLNHLLLFISRFRFLSLFLLTLFEVPLILLSFCCLFMLELPTLFFLSFSVFTLNVRAFNTLFLLSFCLCLSIFSIRTIEFAGGLDGGVLACLLWSTWRITVHRISDTIVSNQKKCAKKISSY